LQSEDGNQEITKVEFIDRIKRRKKKREEKSKRLPKKSPKYRAASEQCLLTTYLSFLLPYLMQFRKSSKKKKMFCFAISHPPLLVNSCQGNLLTYFVVFKMFLGKC